MREYSIQDTYWEQESTRLGQFSNTQINCDGETWILGNCLAEGEEASVYDCATYTARPSDDSVLCRIYHKEQLEPYIRQEELLLSTLSDNRLFSVKGVAEDDTHQYVIFSCPNCNLKVRMMRKPRFTENEAVIIINQLLWKLRLIHQQGFYIGHLCPELVVMKEEGCHVTISPFCGSFTRGVGDHGHFGGFCDQCYAPETLGDRPEFSGASDVFSLTAIAFMLLTGCLPFPYNPGDIPSHIMKGDYNTACLDALQISLPARRLFDRGFDPNPDHRPSVDEILQGEWLEGNFNSPFILKRL